MTPTSLGGSLRSGSAARLLGVSQNTLRAWERRWGHAISSRKVPGGNRWYDRQVVLGLREALDEGLTGSEVVERAAALVASGKYRQPQDVSSRLDRLQTSVEALGVELRLMRQALEASHPTLGLPQ